MLTHRAYDFYSTGMQCGKLALRLIAKIKSGVQNRNSIESGIFRLPLQRTVMKLKLIFATWVYN